ncbi:hypothetical protein FJZ55_06525 [Candidatus Woesearchaeota archaeon]|nr:hypothetical protein [Candidatus Woesearchaeota archaeon]
MKLTSRLLKKIIEEEVAKFGEMETTEDRAKDTEEVDADEFGTGKTAEKHIDYMKALKIEELRLRKRLAKIQETKRRFAIERKV